MARLYVSDETAKRVKAAAAAAGVSMQAYVEARLGAEAVGTATSADSSRAVPPARVGGDSAASDEGFESPAPAIPLFGPTAEQASEMLESALAASTQDRLAIARAALAAQDAQSTAIDRDLRDKINTAILATGNLPEPELPDDFQEPALAYHADEAECPNCGAGNPEPGGHHNEKRCNRNPQHPGHARYRRDK